MVGITQIEQRKMIKRLHKAGAELSAEQVEEMAHSVADQIRQSIKGAPRRMEMPVGRVYKFGDDGNRLGVVPLGWKGFSARYARRGDNNERLLMPMLVRETNVAVGGIANFLHEQGSPGDDMRVRDISAGTPHITFAQRKKGYISQSEERALAQPLESIMPESFAVFDPVIFLKLRQGDPARPIFVRSPGEIIEDGLIEF